MGMKFYFSAGKMNGKKPRNLDQPKYNNLKIEQ